MRTRGNPTLGVRGPNPGGKTIPGESQSAVETGRVRGASGAGPARGREVPAGTVG